MTYQPKFRTFRATEMNHQELIEAGTFFRFIAVGLVNTVVSFVLFLVYFHLLHMHYLVANMAVFVSWVWFGYELQRRLAFRVSKSRRGFVRFLLNQVGFIFVGTVVLWAMVERANFMPEVAYVATLGVVTIGMYASSQLWVFRESKYRDQA